MHGKVVQRVQEGTSGAQARQNKSGNTVHEVFYDYVEGILTGIAVFKHEQYGKQWYFDITDGNDTYRLQLSEGKPLTSLLFALPSCNIARPLRLTPYEFEADGKFKSGITIKQDGQKVPWFFTKENPKGMPELQVVKYQGEDRYDNFERMQFLENYLNEHLKPLLQGQATASLLQDAERQGSLPSASSAQDLPDGADDLPF